MDNAVAYGRYGWLSRLFHDFTAQRSLTQAFGMILQECTRLQAMGAIQCFLGDSGLKRVMKGLSKNVKNPCPKQGAERCADGSLMRHDACFDGPDVLLSCYGRFELVSVQLAEIVVVGRQTKLQRLSLGLGCNRLTTLSCSLAQDLATAGTARG